MFDRKALELQMFLKGCTKKRLAEVCDVAPQTMLRHISEGNFSLREVECICRELEIPDPCPVFFTALVT